MTGMALFALTGVIAAVVGIVCALRRVARRRQVRQLLAPYSVTRMRKEKEEDKAAGRPGFPTEFAKRVTALHKPKGGSE